MATYKVGKVKINGTGLMTGTGTNWTAANALVRVGATVVLATNPVRIYTVGSIISATSIQLSDWGSDAAITTDTNYSILLHDGLTVQGLAQDTAETLRYYRNFEQTLGSAAKLNAGENAGDLMKVGAFGLGSGSGYSVPGDTLSGAELFKTLRGRGCGWWRAKSTPETDVPFFGHGAGFFSRTSDTMAAINTEYGSGKVIVMTSTDSNINAGRAPFRNVLFGTANPPDINAETKGVLSVANGGTGGSNTADARKGLGIDSYIPVLQTPAANDGTRYLELGSVIDAGQGGGYVQFIVGGLVGYGQSRMDTMVLTISARGITTAWNQNNMRLCVTMKRLMGATQLTPTGVEIGVTKVNANTYRIYMKVPNYTGEIKLTQIASMGWNNKQFFRGWFALDGDLKSYDAEPADIRYVAPDIIWDDWNMARATPKVQGLEVAVNGDASVTVNRGIIRGTSSNGNLVIGTDSGDPDAGSVEAKPASVYIRQAGHQNSKVQTQFLPNGDVRSTGQIQGASDVRLKKDFKPINNPLESMMRFRGATFTMINGESEAVGVIAQDIVKDCPQAIGRFETEVNGEKLTDAMAVNSAGFAAAYSVEAMKEVVKLMDLMLHDPEAAKERIKLLKEMINEELPE